MVESDESEDSSGRKINTQYFLDLTPNLFDTQLVIDKLAHNFVPWSLCHPHNTRKNIPYLLALRVRTICDKESDQDTRFERLSSYLANLGYPSSLVADSIQKAKERDQVELRQEKNDC